MPESEAHRRADGQPTIGLAVIAKDEQDTLPAMLDSLGWTLEVEGETALPPKGGYRAEGIFRSDAAVDFVVVVDTGSSDRTVEIAKQRGCRVVDFAWCDDFSAARTVSYEALPAVDFTLWADCDDIIEGAEHLHGLAANMPPAIAGTIHRYDYAQDANGNCTCELWRERLVRQGIGEHWDLPVHEVLKVPGQLMHAEQGVWRHRTPLERERDVERNYKILKADYEKAGDELPSVRTIAYLGTEALALGRREEAIACFEEHLAHPEATWDQERCQVAHKLSLAIRMPQEGESEPSAEVLEASAGAAYRAIQERPDWADGYIDLAEISMVRGESERALAFCDTAQRLDPPRTLLIINPMLYSYQPELIRSVALSKLNRAEEALEATEKVLAVTPERQDIHAQAQAIRGVLMAERAKEQFLGLREILVRHDENWKATKLMECCPYFLLDRPEIGQARMDQREMTLHALEPEVYEGYYRDNPGEAPFELQGVPIADAHETFHRLAFLRAGLDATAKRRGVSKADLRVLDLSANDGWCLANLAEAGYGTAGALHGCELNTGAAQRAAAREQLVDLDAAEVVEANLFDAAEHFDPASYDAVVCFETIEHVPDTRALLEQMCRFASDVNSGQIFVSTPDGAFERGNIGDWARVESKGHLRAMRAPDLAAELCEFGRIDELALEQRLVVAALTPMPRAGKVIFYAGLVDALPEKILEQGMGGSETALVKMAEHFARRGYDVRVYAGGGGGLRGDHVSVDRDEHSGGQVLYCPAAAWDPGERCDLFVASRLPEAFDRTIAAGRRALWLHDADYADRLTEERAARATDIIVLSEFQREHLSERYPFLADHPGLFVSRNGIETEFFKRLPKNRKPWVVYSSSPDRGLDVLLECWPRVLELCAEADIEPQLHHTYAPVYAEFRKQYPHLQAFHAGIEKLQAATESVVAHDHMNQRELARLFAKSKVWAYPSWTSPSSEAFPEISCITAVEAQAAGCVPVALKNGALPESVVSGALLAMGVKDGKLSPAWRERFAEQIVKGLSDEDWRAAQGADGRAFAMTRDWEGVADEWEERFVLSLAGARRSVSGTKL